MKYLNNIKEENNKIVTEYANQQAYQRELNEQINNQSEELRKAKIELNEYENTRIANKVYEIEQKKENIEELKQKILDSEEEQMRKLNAEIEKYNENIRVLKLKVSDEDSELKKAEQQINETIKIKDHVDQNNLQKMSLIEEYKEEISRKINGIQNEKNILSKTNKH